VKEKLKDKKRGLALRLDGKRKRKDNTRKSRMGETPTKVGELGVIGEGKQGSSSSPFLSFCMEKDENGKKKE